MKSATANMAILFIPSILRLTVSLLDRYPAVQNIIPIVCIIFVMLTRVLTCIPLSDLKSAVQNYVLSNHCISKAGISKAILCGVCSLLLFTFRLKVLITWIDQGACVSCTGQFPAAAQKATKCLSSK